MSKLEAYLEEIRNNRQGVKSSVKDHLTASERRRENRLVSAGNRNASTGDDSSHRDEARRINAEIKNLEEKAKARKAAKQHMSPEDLEKLNSIIKDLDKLDYKMDTIAYKKKDAQGSELTALWDEQDAINKQVQALEDQLDALVGSYKSKVESSKEFKDEQKKKEEQWQKRVAYNNQKWQEKKQKENDASQHIFSNKSVPELIKELIVMFKLAQSNSYGNNYLRKDYVKQRKQELETAIRDLMVILSRDYNDNTSKTNITSKENNALRSKFFWSPTAYKLLPKEVMDIKERIWPQNPDDEEE